MFITRDLIVDAGFAAARARMAQFIDRGRLAEVSRDAYEGAFPGLMRVGPFGDAPGVSKLVRVRILGPVRRDGIWTVWLRWEATGVARGLFPVLDADLMLMAEGTDRTRVMLNGCYRAPLGRLGAGLDRAVLHRVASATIGALLRSIAGELAEPGRVLAAA
ncbi:MAG TPA: hypothetical protein VEH31_22020 [Streptosporangiaceae bacterium]|nr:hypothetical protein [Streptosporangiaceae bacterium]